MAETFGGMPPHQEEPKPVSAVESHTEAKKKVVEALLKNPDDLSPLVEYQNVREHSVSTPEQQIEVILDIAEIKLDAGRTEAALEAFEDAAVYAENTDKDELAQNIRNRILQIREQI